MSELVGKIVLERYRVDAFLGKGGMADVYKVWDQARSTYLAMKVLDPRLAENDSFVARFRQEAETLSTIKHPNIVRYYGLEQSENLVFMLMEFVDGQTLRQEILRNAQPMEAQNVLRIMRPVCAALNYAHHLEFVHCDIKPSNIMVDANGTVLLADFGISQVAGRHRGTMHGVGTPAYMAPEQIAGGIPSPAMDIYSIGILLFEMLTGGKRPFTGQYARTSGNTTEKVRWEQRYLAPPSPRQYHSGISTSLEAVVMRCLEKGPERRFENILQLQNELEKALFKDLSQVAVTTPQVENELPLKQVHTSLLPTRGRSNQVKALWLGFSILVPILIVFAIIATTRQALQNTTTLNGPNPINTSTIWQTPIPTWDTYTNTSLGFSIEHPPSWVYRENDNNPIVVIASSDQALNSQGYISDGAALALAYSSLESVDLLSSVDINSPESILDDFMKKNFGSPGLLGSAESLNVDSFPATSAIYATYDSTQNVTVILYGVVVLTPKALVVMLGICSEADKSTYQPVFDRMRDSFRLN